MSVAGGGGGHSALDRVIERRALAGHDGRSGATLERVWLAGGGTLVVKRIPPGGDLVMRATGDGAGRELALWSTGVLDRLPAGVGHPVVDGWQEPDGTVVVVMRDLGSAVLGWHRRLDRHECRRVLAAAAGVHAAYAGPAPSVPDLCPLAVRLPLLWPATMAAELRSGHPLPPLVLRGWELFADLVPGDVAAAVAWAHDDVTRLSGPLSACAPTLAHGDFWLVNLALEDDRVVLLDWGAATLGPGALDLACFLVGNATHVDASREAIVADYVALCGERHDERALQLSLFAALTEMGWNKALDAVDHPDPASRAVAGEELAWWTATARRIADTGGLG